MPVVAPKVKVVRVSGVPSSNVRVIDLGVINATDVFATGLLKLLDYVPGRIVEEIYFTPDNYVPMDGNTDIGFSTPNTILAVGGSAEGGLAKWQLHSTDYPVPSDSVGIQINGGAPMLPGGNGFPANLPVAGYNMRMRDNSPLYAYTAGDPRTWDGPWRIWTANTPVCGNDMVHENGHMWYVTTNGTTGTDKPDFTVAGPITDGTAVWTDDGTTPTQGKLHVHVVVSDQPTTVIPVATSLVFTQQPTNVAANSDITPAIAVQVLDQNGDPFTMFPVQVELAIIGDGTLIWGFIPVLLAQIATDTNGLATFSPGSPGGGVQIGAAGTYRLRARLDYSINLDPTDSDPFNVTAP